jgi:hypothetical protein
MRLSTRSQPGQSNPEMRVVGSMLHIASQSPTRLVTYDLNQPGWFWDGAGVEGLDLRHVLVTRQHVSIIGEKLPPRRNGAVRLMSFSRKPEVKGFLESMHDFIEPTGILAAQAVEGGLYYLAGDQKLHFLAGAGK